ncbi:MAG: caspase family protein [Tabrizicola sp.]|nr:caspase family protein [Tabrizicola sp.]
MMRLGGPLLLLFLAVWPFRPALAEVRAVLVGVSDYQVLDADLQGPGNDVRLMAETLVERGVDPAAITVLTTDPARLPEGVPTGAPTRGAILAALDAVSAPRHRATPWSSISPVMAPRPLT